MGCVSSSWSRAKEFTEKARKRSSVWASIDIDSINLNAEDWTNVFAVSNLIRSQGTDVDVVTNTFERLFSKIPKIKGIFIDAGIIIQLEESKGDPRFRAHIREIVGSLNRILELKSSDSDALEPYLREVREIHRRIKGFHFSYFEVFAHCYEHSFLNLVGPAVSRQQKDAYRKFIIHLVKLLCRDEDLTSTSGASKSGKKRLKSEKDMQDATQDWESLRQADNKYSGTNHRKLKAWKQEEEQTVSTADEQEAGDEVKSEISKAASKSGKKRLKSEKDMQDATQDRESLRQADNKYSGTNHRKLKARKQEEEQTVSTADEQEAGDEVKSEISKAASKSGKKRLKSEKDMQDATQDRESLRQADNKYSGTNHRKLKARKQEEEQTVSTADEQEAGDEVKSEISKAGERKADNTSIVKT